jgi:hypothetical protein
MERARGIEPALAGLEDRNLASRPSPHVGAESTKVRAGLSRLSLAARRRVLPLTCSAPCWLLEAPMLDGGCGFGGAETKQE